MSLKWGGKNSCLGSVKEGHFTLSNQAVIIHRTYQIKQVNFT